MKKSLIRIASLALCSGLLFAGCSTSGSGKSAETTKPAGTSMTSQTKAGTQTTTNAMEAGKKAEHATVNLQDWNGTWNSMAYYLTTPDFKDYLKEEAGKAKISEEEYVKKAKANTGVDFGSVTIKDNHIQFFDGLDQGTAKLLEDCEYKFVASHMADHEGEMFNWHEFETPNSVERHTLLIIDMHGEEGTLRHFHIRYGKDLKDALAKDAFPTLVSPQTKLSQLKENMAFEVTID